MRHQAHKPKERIWGKRIQITSQNGWGSAKQQLRNALLARMGVTSLTTATTVKLPTERMTSGTWNVCTLYACSRVQELTHELERFKWDIIGLYEVRWTGFGEITTEDVHKIWFSREDKRHQYGAAFIIWKEVSNSDISCTPISSRIITIRSSAKPHNITIMMIDTIRSMLQLQAMTM